MTKKRWENKATYLNLKKLGEEQPQKIQGNKKKHFLKKEHF